MANYLRLSGDALDRVRENAVSAFIAEFNKAVSTGAKLRFEQELTKADEKASVYFTELAWLKMQSLVREYNSEIGWHGTASRIDGEENAYLVSDIMVYPQVVTSVTVTPDQKAYQEWLMQQPDEIFNHLRFQAHSHVNMDVTPSAVDTAFYDEIVAQLGPEDFYIFLVINKSGKKHFRIYDMKKNLFFQTTDVSVRIRNDGLGTEDFLADADMKVVVRPVTTTVQKSVSQPVSKPSSGTYGSNTYGTAVYTATAVPSANKQTQKPEVKPFGKSANEYDDRYGWSDPYGDWYDPYK